MQDGAMTKRALLLALLLVALGGFLLHYRIHPVMAPDKANPGVLLFSKSNFMAFIFPLADVVLVTLLFAFRRTALYGFLLNGLIAIYGTIFMAHFSIAQLGGKSLPIEGWILKSTLPDIAILWGDFFIGKALYDLHLKG
jgi:hypothetical protein